MGYLEALLLLNGDFDNVISDLPDPYALFERAAIKEFDGGLDRQTAEFQTIQEYEVTNGNKQR